VVLSRDLWRWTMTDAAHADAMTADALSSLPSADARYELVRGSLRVSEPVEWAHGDVVSELLVPLKRHVRAHGLGGVVVEVGFVLHRDPDTVRAPDVAFLRRDRVPSADAARRFVDGPPDVAAEVLSPNDRAWEVHEKVDDYLAAGTRLVWVVDPHNRRVEVHTSDDIVRVLRAGDALDGGDVIPGFSLPLAELFPAP
jgi:Uma2 family endonuclease